MSRNLFHKLLLLALILILPVFVLMNYSLLRSKKNVAMGFTSDFAQQTPVEVEKSFVIILCVDQSISEKTLNSFFEQSYDNYRILLIDNMQDQRVIQEIYQAAYRYNKEQLLSILQGDSDSLYHAVHSCRDDEIVLQMDASDWLSHEHVLERINQIYANENVWLAYSQYLEYPSWTKGKAKPFLKKTLRKPLAAELPWFSSPFKTYYAGLFKQADSIVALIEMSDKHIRFIEDPLYVHCSNTISNK